MMLVERTALSVEMSTRCRTFAASAASTTLCVPSTLLRNASSTFVSMSGTCLCAAA